MERLSTPPYLASGLGWGSDSIVANSAMRLYAHEFTTNPFDRNEPRYHLTAKGWEYSDQLQLGPVLYWLDKNWFPATVAATTILVGIGTILAQVLE